MPPAPLNVAVIEELVDPPTVPALSCGRALVPVIQAGALAVRDTDIAAVPSPLDEKGSPDFQDIQLDVTVRKMSPRKMADVSMELYASGIVSWEEYAMLAFQPDLHPDYERTIGALTGSKAQPDTPRDFIKEWEKRLAFEERYNIDRPYMIERSRHILNILRMLDVRARLLNIG